MASTRLSVVLWIVLVGAVTGVTAQDSMESFRLGLDEALRIGLENNLELVSARYVPEMAEQEVTIQDSAFDVGLEARLDENQSKTVPLTFDTRTDFKRETGSVGVGQELKFGANYSVGFGTTRTEQSGTNVVAASDYTSGFNLQFEMPLLKNLGTETTTETLILARSDLEISRSDLEGQAEVVIEQVEGAYWDVVAAREALRVARESLARAEDLLELNRKKVEVGTLAPIEITQAEAGVASEEEGVIAAEETLGNAEDELRRLLAIPAGDPRWVRSIDTTDRPVLEQVDIDLEAAIDTALQARPEIVSARQTLRNRELSERVAKRQVRHELNLTGGYGPSGVSFDFPGAGAIPPSESSFGDSIDKLFEGGVYSWNLGLIYRLPIGNRAAKAGYATATLSREQAEVDLANQEQSVRVEVRRSARSVDSGIKRVEAARVNVVLQRKKLEAERKKFENGMSTTFEVRQFQRDLSDAELSLIRAALGYARALTALERSKGTLLESRGLRLD